MTAALREHEDCTVVSRGPYEPVAMLLRGVLNAKLTAREEQRGKAVQHALFE